MSEKAELIDRIADLTGWKINPARLKIVTDTSDWLNISRGDVIRLEGKDYAARGYMREFRFGIDDQPKYWVFSAIDLADGSEKIIKTEFHEEFHAHIGIFKIKCYRSPAKEEAALNAARGDLRFMQGRGARDDKGNIVRIIDFIRGKSLFKAIPDIEKSHLDYYKEDLPTILLGLYDSFQAIGKLHSAGLYHGDIRTDHIISDAETGLYRWIDFDLNQNVSDFDLWSIGNIICYAAAKGILTFESILNGNDFNESVKNSLQSDDASAFYEYRVMNIAKVYPYISKRLNAILMHFTIAPASFYESFDALIADYEDMLKHDFGILNLRN